MDRRDALKAAVAAGAAWSTPRILSSSGTVQASALACTPKCAPQVGSTFTGTVTRLGCEPQGPFNEIHPHLWQVNPIVSPGSVCPCGGDPFFINAPETVTVRDWEHGRCTGPDGPFHVALIPEQTVTIGCVDRTGRRICKQCSVSGRFQYCHVADQDTPCTDENFPSVLDVEWTVVSCVEEPTCC
jgi:hypothetical protein